MTKYNNSLLQDSIIDDGKWNGTLSLEIDHMCPTQKIVPKKQCEEVEVDYQLY